MRRTGALLLGASIVALAARCTFDGLDQYTSGSKDAGDASADAAPDVNPGCALCSDAQACVKGKCETCTPTWSVPFTNVNVRTAARRPKTETSGSADRSA